MQWLQVVASTLLQTLSQKLTGPSSCPQQDVETWKPELRSVYRSHPKVLALASALPLAAIGALDSPMRAAELARRSSDEAPGVMGGKRALLEEYSVNIVQLGNTLEYVGITDMRQLHSQLLFGEGLFGQHTVTVLQGATRILHLLLSERYSTTIGSRQDQSAPDSLPNPSPSHPGEQVCPSTAAGPRADAPAPVGCQHQAASAIQLPADYEQIFMMVVLFYELHTGNAERSQDVEYVNMMGWLYPHLRKLGEATPPYQRGLGFSLSEPESIRGLERLLHKALEVQQALPPPNSLGEKIHNLVFDLLKLVEVGQRVEIASDLMDWAFSELGASMCRFVMHYQRVWLAELNDRNSSADIQHAQLLAAQIFKTACEWIMPNGRYGWNANALNETIDSLTYALKGLKLLLLRDRGDPGCFGTAFTKLDLRRLLADGMTPLYARAQSNEQSLVSISSDGWGGQVAGGLQPMVLSSQWLLFTLADVIALLEAAVN